MAPASAIVRADDPLAARLHERAGAARWGVSLEAFASALDRSARQGLASDSPDRGALARYLESLHVEDLALACACRDGHPEAWDHFMTHVRPELYRAARVIAGDAGRELADGLAADLYGSDVAGGERRSLFDYFHGRSRLTTWLRAVLARRHVDRMRAERRLASLDEISQNGSGDQPATVPRAGHGGASGPAGVGSHSAELDPDRPRLVAIFEDALARAVANLPPADRFALAAYYVQGLTLAELARLRGEHESSVSRRLARLRRDLRKQVEHELRTRHRLDEGDLHQCYEDAGRLGSLDAARLLADR
jgi:RNA polymerase sigma-70 factor (ECF subfamily)